MVMIRLLLVMLAIVTVVFFAILYCINGKLTEEQVLIAGILEFIAIGSLIIIRLFSNDSGKRLKNGLPCPVCEGYNTTPRLNRFEGPRYICHDCGHSWIVLL